MKGYEVRYCVELFYCPFTYLHHPYIHTCITNLITKLRDTIIAKILSNKRIYARVCVCVCGIFNFRLIIDIVGAILVISIVLW